MFFLVSATGGILIASDARPEFDSASNHWSVGSALFFDPDRSIRLADGAGGLADAYMATLEKFYDTKAAERRYDNRITCIARAGYTGPFQAEGQAYGTWMDTCNAIGYQIMVDVSAGTRAMPTFGEVLAEMPPLVWPV